MPRRKPAPSTAGHLRREIACLAARMMAEDGIDDYGFAKRKAARSLGAGEGDALPGNDEVETELRAYQSLYHEDELRERVQAMRVTALDAMQFLAEFHPYLTGSTLDGTAGRYAAIEIHLYADSAKDVEIMLLSHNISYEVEEQYRHDQGAPEAGLRMDWHGFPVLLSVYPLVAERQRKRNAHSGHRPARAGTEAVAALIGK